MREEWKEGGGVRGCEASMRSVRGYQAAICVHVDTESGCFGCDEADFACLQRYSPTVKGSGSRFAAQAVSVTIFSENLISMTKLINKKFQAAISVSCGCTGCAALGQATKVMQASQVVAARSPGSTA